MKLENLFRKGKNFTKRTLAAGLIASSIFFASCRIDPLPIPLPEPPKNELSENTQILTQDELSRIYSVEGDKIVFSNPIPYSTGDIIVCDISDATPNGLLRKVTSTSSDRQILYTEQTNLEDAIKNADVHFATNTLSSSSARATEIQILDFEQNFDNTVLFDFDGDYSTTYDQIIANGDLSGSLKLNLDLKIDNNHFEEFTFKTVINQDSSFEIRKGWGVPSFDYEFDIGAITFPSFVMGYIPTTPPLPVTVTPSLDLHVGINGELPEWMAVIQRANLTSGLHYEKNNGWDIISEAFGFWDCFPRSAADMSDFKIYAGPKLNMLVYNVAGPYGEINAYVGRISTLSSWELRVGSEVNLGARMRIFSWNIADYSANVIDKYTVLSEGETEEPDPILVTIQPGPVEGKDAFVTMHVFSDDNRSYTGTDDTYLDVDKDYWGYNVGYEQETLMQFQLSSIPLGSTIISATLNLYGQGAFPIPETSIVKIKEILEPWNESTVKWDNKPSYGDYIDSSTLIDEMKWHEWDITSLVQEWINGEPNYGLALLTDYHRPTGEDWGFKSSDYSYDPSKRPKLEVSYY